MVIAHNMMAMNAQRQFNIVGNSKKKSTEKLSSGYRVNRAADDAAGLSISEKMRRQIRGLNQGANNTMDGISLLQVADGALAEVHDMLHRVTELSVQSANGTNTDSDREAIQQEINQIMSEINRISDTTEFNERPLFQGATGTTVIPAVYEPSTASNFRVTGSPNDNAIGKVSISANSAGVNIGGTNYGWSQLSDGNGHTLSDGTITAGKYSISHNGMSLSVDVSDNASLDDVAKLLNGASYTTKVGSYETKKVSDIIELAGGVHFYEHDGYVKKGEPTFNLSGNILSLNTGLLDKNQNELKYDFEDGKDIIISSGNSHAYEGLSTPLDAGAELQLTYSGGIVARLNVKEATTLQDVLTALDNSEIKYTETPQNSLISLYYTDRNGDIQSISTCPSDLLAGGYDYISLQNNITFTHKTIDGVDALVADNNKFIMKKVSESSTTNFYATDSGLSHVYVNKSEGDLDTYFAKFYSDPVWYDLSIDGINFPDTTIKTNVVTALDKYADSGYKGTLVSPEQRLHSDGDLDLWIQSGAEVGDGMYITIGIMDTDALGINTLDVTTVDGAGRAIDAAGKATEMISALRSNIGAQQNRLEHTYRNVTNTAENTTAAESRIRDTDMAKEMVELSKQNILEQVGQSMIAQANQSNQGVLSLLQ